MHTHMHTHTLPHACTHTHTHTHCHMHAHTHAHTQVPAQARIHSHFVVQVVVNNFPFHNLDSSTAGRCGNVITGFDLQVVTGVAYATDNLQRKVTA